MRNSVTAAARHGDKLLPVLGMPRHSATLTVVLVCLTLAACKIRLVSDYDEVIDHSVTEFHEKVEAFLVKMEATHGTLAGQYASNHQFYDDARVSLSTIRLRASALPKNEITQQQIEELAANIENLRRLHETSGSGGLTPTVTAPVRSALDTQCRAILTLEVAKKRGQSEAK